MASAEVLGHSPGWCLWKKELRTVHSSIRGQAILVFNEGDGARASAGHAVLVYASMPPA